ncbi:MULTISPECIES: protein translocase subunit SecF [Cohnella]|uniref:protein translocase subunit SecF n=1 Tax=Cohnella TaxID=329857 RepID=UPI00036D8DAA|nr:MULTISPECIES: protein translocase subunit SecF [Cohnella]REK62940.1 MAG: protein translocase subunit SecF [Cohnella sp.]
MRYNFKNFDFVRKSKAFFIGSIVTTLIGIVSLFLVGLNYGIDFKSGSSVDVVLTKAYNADEVKSLLDSEGFGQYTLTAGDGRLSIRFEAVLDEAQQQKLQADFHSKIDDKASFEINIVDVDIAREQETNALIGILVASVGILLYVTIRFEWRFAVAAIVALLYDAFFVITLFSVFRLEVNLPFILAVLTVIGYSINDTVVIFDRIRENLRFAKIKTHDDLANVVNTSVSQTLTRSINTVLTVAFAAICLFIFGSESIKMFSLAMIFGLISGAYSSIFIASPLWYLLRRNAKPKKPAKVQNAP